MTKNGETTVRFDRAFTPEIDLYINECKENNAKCTVKGFATRIGTDVFALWQWANKKKRNDSGELTDELARPNFHIALTKLDKLEQEEKKDKLNVQQELFCQYFASDREFFANGTQSYIEAYGLDRSKKKDYANAMSAASELLRNPKIIKRINDLLEDSGLNDAFVDKQLVFVISQSYDLSSKVAAIKEYNKLKSRITEKVDHTTKGKELPTPILGGASNVSTDNSAK